MPKQKSKSDKKGVYALIPTRDVVALPGVVVSLYAPQGGTADAVSSAMRDNSFLVLALQSGPAVDTPAKQNISRIGAFARVIHSIRLSGGDLRVRLHIQGRAKITGFSEMKPFIKVEAESIPEQSKIALNAEQERLIAEAKEKFAVLSQFDQNIEDHIAVAKEIFDPGSLADLIGSTLPLDPLQVQGILEEIEPFKRLAAVIEALNTYIDTAAIKERISSRAQNELGRAHHEELLREQLRQIQAELGEAPDYDDDLESLSKQLEKLKMPAEVKKEAQKQFRRLQQLHPDTSEAALARTYLDWIVDLPWGKRSKDRLDLRKAKAVLEEDHFGLEKPKERILDFLGVRKLRADIRGPILLLVGPPGVGKTSLGRSIARALGRKFVRASVGGLRDEAELRGHRRTYVGALPGRIIQGLKTAGTKNPVFMIDELDKIGSDFRGDPSAVLLEVLDPEQNTNFEDHYLNVPFDLSEVMFIATANMTDTIPSALYDRMETIEIAGYTSEEKVEIAKRYLVPRQREENGLGLTELQITDAGLLHIIECYTRESGVRELGRNIGTVYRKVARGLAEGGKAPDLVTPDMIEEFLGPLKYLREERLRSDEVGVSTGLAWTPVGGETLTLEVSITRGKGSLSLTGQMGEVMRESAMAALTYVQSNAERFGINPDFYENSNVHIHVPQGAIPKDGPSAGVAIATALVSALSGRPVSRNVSMTGEITLRGNVLQIGGLKEKSLAALRAGIPVVVIPKDNERDLVEFPKYLKDKVTFVPVKSIDEVLEVALVVDSKKGELKSRRTKKSAAVRAARSRGR